MIPMNAAMLNQYHRYFGVVNHTESTKKVVSAYQIVYAEAKEKIVELFYMVEGSDKLRSLQLPAKASLSQIMCAHGDAFIKVNRNYLVNTVMLTGVFPVSDKEHGCTVKGATGVIPVSRRSVTLARRAYAQVNK